MNIGMTVRKLRLVKGITQEQLAGALDVSVQTVSRWETSANYPDIIMLPLLAGFFGVTTDCLLNVGGNAEMKTLESGRLLIREWQEGDARALPALFSEPGASHSGFKPDVITADPLETIRMWKKYQEIWPVFEKDGDTLAGVIGLSDVGRHKKYRELELFFREAFYTQAHVCEAIALALEYGFGELGLEVVAASLTPFETRLKQSLEKMGFAFEGTLRKYGRDLSDRLRYCLLAGEYARSGR